MYIERKLESKIRGYLNHREIIAIVGPRQSGKTTLLQKLQSGTENSILLSFEDREVLELFETDIKNFAVKYFHSKYIFIDEFQYSKNGGKQLKYLYDTYPDNKIIISGSSVVELSIHTLRFLVGRIFSFTLYQLDFEEYLNFKASSLLNIYRNFKKSINLADNKISEITISAIINTQFYKALEDFILWGGYPRVVLSETVEEKRLVLKNIYNTYFLRDIRDISGLADDFRLSKLIKSLALQIGQLVASNELSNITGYEYITLKKYLNILEKTFICKYLTPFYNNKRKEIVKIPKIYFFDTGLRNLVLSDFNSLENRIDKGFLYENFIFCQLIKNEFQINFWRTKTKREIDFIINLNNKTIPLESKSRLDKSVSVKSMYEFLSNYKSTYGIITSETGYNLEKDKNSTIYSFPHWII
jgi:uncharacterized protein